MIVCSVTCLNIDEFLQNLRVGGLLLNNSVYMNSIDKKITDAKYEIFLQASAVQIITPETQQLIQVGMSCGVDYRDASNDATGTSRMMAEREKINKFAEQRGIVVLPGIVGF